MARVALGMPLFEAAEHVGEAIDDLLAQSHRDFVLVIVDDVSADGSGDVALAHSRHDARVTYRRNDRRLGLAANWRATFAAAREQAPDAQLFAWVGHHDHWHPGWLAALVAALDTHPAAVLAYPRDARLTRAGTPVDPGGAPFDTVGQRSDVERLRLATRGMVAGSMVYGLARSAAVERAAVFRDVVAPDRLLVAELALEGEFVQVDEVLWRRRATGRPTVRRQRSAIFPAHVPASARVAWPFVHGAVLARRAGPRVAGAYVAVTTGQVAWRRALELGFALEGRLPAGLSAALRRAAGILPRRVPELHDDR